MSDENISEEAGGEPSKKTKTKKARIPRSAMPLEEQERLRAEGRYSYHNDPNKPKYIEQRIERAKRARESMTDEKKEERRAAGRKRAKEARESMTPEQKAELLKINRKKWREKKLKMDPEEILKRRAKDVARKQGYKANNEAALQLVRMMNEQQHLGGRTKKRRK